MFLGFEKGGCMHLLLQEKQQNLRFKDTFQQASSQHNRSDAITITMTLLCLVATLAMIPSLDQHILPTS